MAKNSFLYCWTTALISLTFLNFRSCGAGNLTRASCDMSSPVRTKGAPSTNDEFCWQYFDEDSYYTFYPEDCAADESLNCCDGVCQCCDGRPCVDDSDSNCYDLQISGGGSSSDGCRISNAPRRRCTENFGGKAVKNYSDEDCWNEEYPYLNCCDGECVCCRASNLCPDDREDACENEHPPKSGGGSRTRKNNGTIIL
ncbi:unnamed protein product [Orchesella dallaii]|uniref:Uncharacterized protein n=1 Tax=Orchesella dallaii TaxID=48710 RepID=A0ABP1QDB9_9HEXA